MSKIETSKDLILHFLYVPGATSKIGEPIQGRTRLQKMIFLFEKEIWKDFKLDKVIAKDVLPEFTAYDFGPFSKTVADDIGFLIDYKMVVATKIQSGSAEEEDFFLKDVIEESEKAIVEHSYKLSDLGKKFIESGRAGELTANQVEVLSNFKKRVNSISLDALLGYVYTKYPAMTSKSKIKEKVLSRTHKNGEEDSL